MIGVFALIGQSATTIVAGPYLQLGGSPSTMVVQMIQKGDSKIQVGSRSGKVRELPSIKMALPGLRMVKFAIDEVPDKPILEYSVTEGGQTKSYSAHNLRQSKGKVRLALFGDSGRGLPGQKLVAKQVAKYDPDLIVHVGDIVYPHGRESEYLKFHFPYYGSILSKTPSAAAPGNHDTAYRKLSDYPDGLAYYKIWHTPIAKPSWAKDRGNYSFSFGNSYWVIIDSNPYNNWGGKPAQEWLNNELKKGAKFSWRFVAFHHPPYHSSDKKKTEIHMRAISPILEANRVQAVFCGHVHNYQRAKVTPKGPLYVVTGAGGAELYDQKIAKDKKLWQPYTQAYIPGYSFTSLEIDSRTAILRQISAKGEVIDKVTLMP